MSLIKCPECAKEVSDKAKSCPNCGFEFNHETPNQSSNKKKKGISFRSWVFLIIIVFIAYKMIFSPSHKESTSSSSSNNKFLAYNYAEDFVEKKLKSPSTAEFPGTLEKAKHITELGNNEYQIVSWVDSQNGFGGTVRTKFTCIIKFNGSEVSCKEMQFLE